MVVDSIRGSRVQVTRASWIEWGLVAGIGVLLIGLVWIHPLLDEMIDPRDESVSDETRFYGLHRIYLWLSTFQWIFAWIWLYMIVVRWSKESKLIHQTR